MSGPNETTASSLPLQPPLQRSRQGRASTHPNRFLSNVGLLVASLFLICALLEIASIPFLPPPIRWREPQELYDHDPQLMHRLRPNQQSFTHAYPVSTNSYGLRERELPLKPDPGVFRILCLGDSLTFGNGVQFADTYPKQLEVLLNGGGSRAYEVINAGVNAYDTWQEVEFFRRTAKDFEPRVVIIGFYANDIVPRPKRIVTTVDASGFRRRVGVKGFLPNPIANLLRESRILLFLRQRYDLLANRITPSPEYRHESALLTGTPDDFVEAGWNEVERSLLQMTDLSHARDFQLLIVIFPMVDQLLRSYPSAAYPARLTNFAMKHGIRFLDLTSPFSREFTTLPSLFIEWDGHPNASAYAITAREIRDYLRRHSMIPASPPGLTEAENASGSAVRQQRLTAED